MNRLRDIIRIKEKDSKSFYDAGYFTGKVDGHNSLLNIEVDVDVEEIVDALQKDFPWLTDSLKRAIAKTIKTALLSGKVIKEKK